MYLHLGQETVVRLDEVVGIFDMDKSTISKHSRQFLADAEKGGRVFNVSEELPKSYVVCVDGEGTETVYISSRALSSWCRQKGISLDTMLQELQLHGYAQYGINTKRFALGKDVPTLPNGAQTVYCFRVERNYGDTISA